MEEKIRDSTGTPPPPAATSEAPASEQPTSRRRQKRKTTSLNSGGGSSNHQSSSKRQAREKLPPMHFPPIHMNGPLTRVRLQPNSINSFSQGEVLVKNEVEAQEAAARSEEISRVSENWEALEAKIEAEYESIKTRDASVHVVPIHAGWFSWKKIHPLEKRMLPSFFNEKPDKRNPEMYMEIRNWIMKKFHLDPSLNIELKHLSELTVGELDARQEVMEFLDYWGLINYHPFPQNEPASMNVDPDSDETQKKTNNLVEKLFKFETVQSWSPLIPMNTAVPATQLACFRNLFLLMSWRSLKVHLSSTIVILVLQIAQGSAIIARSRQILIHVLNVSTMGSLIQICLHRISFSWNRLKLVV